MPASSCYNVSSLGFQLIISKTAPCSCRIMSLNLIHSVGIPGSNTDLRLLARGGRNHVISNQSNCLSLASQKSTSTGLYQVEPKSGRRSSVPFFIYPIFSYWLTADSLTSPHYDHNNKWVGITRATPRIIVACQKIGLV